MDNKIPEKICKNRISFFTRLCTLGSMTRWLSSSSSLRFGPKSFCKCHAALYRNWVARPGWYLSLRLHRCEVTDFCHVSCGLLAFGVPLEEAEKVGNASSGCVDDCWRLQSTRFDYSFALLFYKKYRFLIRFHQSISSMKCLKTKRRFIHSLICFTPMSVWHTHIDNDSTHCPCI